jgi:ATP-dependent DNA helicase RecQ
VDALAKSTRYSPTLVERALQRLEDVGSVESGTDGVIAGAKAKLAVKAADAAAAMQEKHRTVARTRLEMMRQYADTSGCRRAFILGYFGEAFSPPCGNCDNCLSGRSIEVMPDEVPFPISSRVLHPVWAEGEVVRYENDTITVLFADAGYRTLSIELALEKHLLSAVTT